MKERPAKSRLKDLNVRPSKERGQNFLIDQSVIDKIVEFGEARKNSNLIEIGPGLGALTKELIKVTKLTVIELESKFCIELQRQFPDLKIINKDVRQVDFNALGTNLHVFGNLPYVYSTDILFHLINYSKNIDEAVLLLQKEFAERVAASPGGRDYGSLSVAAQISADISLGPIIEGNCFHPPTKVQSRLLKLKFFKEPRYAIEDPIWFTKVVRGSFLQRRKKLTNSLKAAGIVPAEKISEALVKCKIDSNRRAETLSIEEFMELARALKSY